MLNSIFSSDGNEYMVNGSSIHETWQYAWPRVIARAWNIEYLLLKNNYITEREFNAGELEPEGLYEKLRTKIEDTLIEPDNAIPILENNCNIGFDDEEKLRLKDRSYRNEFLEKVLDQTDLIKLKYFYEKILEEIHLEDFKRNSDRAPETKYKINEADFIWFKKLLCHKSEMVLDALKDEGFIVNAMENPPTNFDRNCSTRIIVRKANQPYEIGAKRKSKSGYNKQVETTQRVSVCYKPKVNPNYGTPPPLAGFNENLNKSFAGLGKNFHGEGEQFRGSRPNGWKEVKGLGHVLVVTLPTPPDEPSEYGLAIAEYEASGKVYSFTCCT